MTFRVVVFDRLRDGLQDHGFSRLGGRHDQPALSLAYGGHQVDDPRRQVFRAAVAHFQLQTLLGEQRRQVFEDDLVLGSLRRLKVDLVDLEQREIALADLGRPDLAGNVVAGAQVEAPDLAGGHIDVVRPRQVGTAGGAQKPESVLQDLKDAIPVDVLALLCVGLENLEDDILFSGAGQAVQAQGF